MISVVIRTLNAGKNLDKLLQILKTQTVEHEVIVVDSGSTDDTVDVAKKYGVSELEHEHETKLQEDYGPVFFLENFPNYTSPFWNMQQDTSSDSAKKVDVIMHGVETIGSAERSCDPEEMRKQFY